MYMKYFCRSRHVGVSYAVTLITHDPLTLLGNVTYNAHTSVV